VNLLDETKMLLTQYNLRANKRIGQNFMINQEIVDEIIEKANLSKEDVVLEIGPGLGSLTKELINNAGKVIAVELDQNMINILNDRFAGYENLKIIQNDILKVNLKDILNSDKKIKVIANLPYYITTPIIMKLLEDRLNIDSIIVMVQKEVGERICAKPGSKEYGAITVSVNYYSNSKIIINVPKENFLPEPEVDSCVIKLDVLEKPSVIVKNERLFFSLIKTGFSQRRKTILNSLSNGYFSKEEISKVLKTLNVNEKLRAENLSVQDFANISNELVIVGREFINGYK
jgi:16S rRNA (adenine1518-N6/adenine1519-N6)-dimethyltransferase